MIWDVRAGQLVTVHSPIESSLEGLQGFITRIRRKFSLSLTDGSIDVWLPRCICDSTFSAEKDEGLIMSFLPNEIEVAEGFTWRSVHNFLQYVQRDGQDRDPRTIFAAELQRERRKMNGSSRKHR